MEKLATVQPLDAYMAEIGRFPVLDREQELELARAYQSTQDPQLATELVTRNLRFVVKIANNYRRKGIPTLDLIQEGNIGLMHAVKKFDPERGYRLISYAVWWIRAYIQAHLMKAHSLVKLGTTQAQRKLFFGLEKAKRKLAGAEGDPLEPERLAEALGVSVKDLQQVEMRIAARDFFLDQPLADGSGTSHLDQLADEDPGALEGLLSAERQDALKKSAQRALRKLPKRERTIIRKRLMAEKPTTLAALGGELGLSRERVRQLEDRAKRRLVSLLTPEASSLLRLPVPT